MNRWRIAGGLTLIFLWTNPYSALAQHKQRHDHGHDKPTKHEANGPKLPLCPVMGDPIDFSAKTVTDDGLVYFCCASCVEKYENNPQKYASKVAAQRAALKKLSRIQVTCPLSGQPIEQKAFLEHDGQKVYFCCDECKGKFSRNPDKYAGKLEASHTYQTRCPVKGGKIDPSAFVDLPTGQRVYFCCQECDDKLLKNPEKYAAKLVAQGINIDVEKLKGGGSEHAERGGHDHGNHSHGDHDKP